MGDMAMDRTQTTRLEAILSDELASANRALRGVAPVIAHMLETSGPALVSDAIVARLRGMVTDLSRQLLPGSGEMQAQTASDTDREEAVDALADALADDPAILNHLYALAMEGYLTERLEHRTSLDPVLSPLLQELIASDQPAIAELAMSALAAQSRFVQSQRRMELGLGELPADLFGAALETLGRSQDDGNGAAHIATLKAQYDEATSRLGLLARLASAMRGGAVAALELEHAGLALFATALSALTKQPRDLCILACHERQAARLALSLRATGQGEEAIERQFLLIEPSLGLPEGIGAMPPERASHLLATSSLVAG